MNIISSSSSTLETLQKYACHVITQCYSCINCARRRRIYPDSCYENHNKIVKFQSNKLIRVIHLKNIAKMKSHLLDSSHQNTGHSDCNKRTFSFSDSDYAFTCWSKPLRLCDECRQSLKTLLQGNVNNAGAPQQSGEELTEDVKLETLDSHNLFTQNNECLSSIETFVDAFVKSILKDAIVSASEKSVQTYVSLTDKNNKLACAKKSDDGAPQCAGQWKAKGETNSFVKTNAMSNSDSIFELGSCHDQTDFQERRFTKIKTNGSVINHPNIKAQTQLNQSSEDKFAYYNSSYSDAGEETNIVHLQMTEKNDTVQKRNFSICTHLKNKPSKPILLFLHGVGCSADLWTHLLCYFEEEGYEIVAPDMLGHGYSSTPDCPSAYTFHNLLKDTLDIFDKFIGEMKCVVIGHAFGCSLAAALARYRPHQVTQLVLISGGGPTPLAPRTADFKPPAISPWLQMCLKPFLLCGLKREILYVPCGKHIETANSVNSGVPSYVLHHIARGQDWQEGDSAFHRRILVPTLLVHGMKDPYVTLVQECEMERTIPRSSLELIANAGHFAMLETPDKLCHMLQCFISWWNL